jgi:DNA processing protein
VTTPTPTQGTGTTRTGAGGPPATPTIWADGAAAVAAATLAALPGITPGRLEALLSRWPDPIKALEAVAAGRGPEAVPGAGLLWPASADPAPMAATLARRGTRILLSSGAGFPIADGLPHRPAVLLAEGDRPEVLAAPRVAVVGTRAASPHGLADAHRLGAFLGAAGISVVSGLAIGIDAAAHAGAVAAVDEGSGPAGPIGVVATGLDVVYPRRHTALFDQVRRRGLLIGEHGFGVPPSRGRFPVRNRIIAALADVVVVVEATERGGARITAERALDYGRPVLAVPGSRRNPAAAGCNALLADGAHPLLDPTDVLVALGLTPGARRGWSTPSPKRRISPEATRVEQALAGEPAHPDDLAARTGLPPDALAVALEDLADAGRIQCSRGYVWPV